MKWRRHIVWLLMLLFSGIAQAQLNTDRITAIGRNALYFEDYVLSIQYFNQVIKLKPYLAEPYLLRAIAKIQLQDYTGALTDCNASIARNPFQPGAYYTRGYVHRAMENMAQAESDFSQALVYSPENKSYLMLRADVRAQQNDYVNAMQDIDFLLGKEPKSPTLLFEKGIICLHSKDTTCAYQSLSQAVRYDSQNASNWSALGLVSMYLNQEDEALEDLSKSIALGSKWAGDYINRGVIYYRRHNYRGALADYDQAIQMSPRDGQCYYNRGMLRAELGDYNRALDDLNQAVELQPEQTEMRYQRGMVLLQLGQWTEAAEDFKELISRYPYFLPSYYLAAQAATALGEKKKAYDYRQQAYQLEQKKDSIMMALRDTLATPNTDVQIAASKPQQRDRRKEFSARTAQTGEVAEDESIYQSDTRGQIQKKYQDVVNEGNIVLSYYRPSQTMRQSRFYYPLDQYNRQQHLPAPLYLTSQEISLTAEMVNSHFEHIHQLTEQLNRQPDADIYFARAMEFALVQDYASATDDCTKAMLILRQERGSHSTEEAFYTFCRANWRYRLLEYQRANGELQTEYQGKTIAQRIEMDFDIMLRDYDYCIQQIPDFAYAYYNKANMLCAQKEYKSAIEHYSKAIQADADLAEAYFNRGLTYIYTDDVEHGIQDLSKAGELGIYQAYNLITRFQ